MTDIRLGYRPPKGTRCVALDGDAKRCRRPAVVGVQYHGDGELYGSLSGGTEPTWVIAFFCGFHGLGK